MRMVIDPGRFRRMLENILIYKGKPMLDSVLAEFTPKGVRVRDMTLDTIAVYAIYKKKYFYELEVEGDKEMIPLSKSLLTGLGYGFGGDKIIVETKGDDIFILDEKEKERFKDTLLELKETEFAIEMKPTDKGIISSVECPVQVQIDVGQITGLPTADEYEFETNNGALEVTIKVTGEYTRPIELGEVEQLEEMKATFIGPYLQQLAGNFVGEVWVLMRDEGVTLTQRKEEFLLSYLQTSNED